MPVLKKALGRGGLETDIFHKTASEKFFLHHITNSRMLLLEETPKIDRMQILIVVLK